MALPIFQLHHTEYSYIFVQNSFKTNFYEIILKCHVRIEIDNSELGVIGDFTTISALQSLRLRLRDPNIANRCKIAYNPSLVVVYFYILLSDDVIT